jgi:hypothetical protein
MGIQTLAYLEILENYETSLLITRPTAKAALFKITLNPTTI